MKFIKFINYDNIPKRLFVFTLGKIYTIDNLFCKRFKFIQPTKKGFNLLDMDTHKCILKSHMYCKKYRGIEIPRHENMFKVPIPNWLGEIIEEDVENTNLA